MSRKLLAGRLLDEANEAVEKEVATSVKGQYVSLVSDGWSDVHQKPIVATVMVSGSLVFPIKFSLATGEKNAEACAEQVKTAANLAETKYGVTVVGFVSDNEPKMKKTRKLLTEWRPSLVAVGCGAHYINLCEKKASPAAIKEGVMSVQRFFKEHHRPHLRLTDELGGKEPQISNDTR